MASKLEKKDYSNETIEILEATSQNKNFLLSGGAGSGKTYSLVETISALTNQQPLAQIACITYTNAATQEIEHRAGHENLHVSTIHDFLWSNIKNFQREMKAALIELINDEEQNFFKLIDSEGKPEKITSIEGEIQYKDYLKLRSGIISHDQVPILANALFSKHPKLCRILNDKFKFILVDEYQDTNRLVIDILLQHLSCTSRRNIVGFFGDAMQSIYDYGIGDLNDFKGSGKNKVTEIKKEQNRRNPLSIIKLANRFRTDGLVQTPSNDESAPNMDNGKPIIGSAKFLYSSNLDVQAARDYLNWEKYTSQTKELNLTHNLIATKAGFPELMRIYDSDKILEYVKRIREYIALDGKDYLIGEKKFVQVIQELQASKTGKTLEKVTPTKSQADYIAKHPEVYQAALSTPFTTLSSIYVEKDMLIDDQKADQSILGGGGTTRDHLIKHLYRIQSLIQLYRLGNYNDFLRSTDYKINSHAKKIQIKKDIEELSQASEKSIEEIIELAHAKGLVRKDDRLLEFKHTKGYIYDQVCKVRFKEFQNLFGYIDGQTPFSTKHKTKGREYDNVLVVLDNGKWNKYNFEAFFTGNGKDTVIERTSKLIYVCCTRARRELAFFYPQPTLEVVNQAKLLFGEGNVINLDPK